MRLVVIIVVVAVVVAVVIVVVFDDGCDVACCDVKQNFSEKIEKKIFFTHHAPSPEIFFT